MELTHEEEQWLRLGKMVTEMIGEVAHVAKSTGEPGYARRNITYRNGGKVTMFLVTDEDLANKMEAGAAQHYTCDTIKPPSKVQ